MKNIDPKKIKVDLSAFKKTGDKSNKETENDIYITMSYKDIIVCAGLLYAGIKIYNRYKSCRGT